jgi:hypothetical protein
MMLFTRQRLIALFNNQLYLQLQLELINCLVLMLKKYL